MNSSKKRAALREEVRGILRDARAHEVRASSQMSLAVECMARCDADSARAWERLATWEHEQAFRGYQEADKKISYWD